MEKFRVVVVDDSRFMRKIFSDIIDADSQFTVVATAENGKKALDLIDDIKPDLVTLDLEMPEMNGIDALQSILVKHKIPIIMLSGISEENTKDTIRALQYGAFDFIRKPTSVGGNAQDIVSTGELLLEKMKIAVLTKRKRSFYQPVIDPKQELKKLSDKQLKLVGTPKTTNQPIINNKVTKKNSHDDQLGKSTSTVTNKKLNTPLSPVIPKETIKTNQPSTFARKVEHAGVHNQDNNKKTTTKQIDTSKITQLVAIGTSTGGPRALHEVISNIPAGFSAPIVVVQHMPPKFTHSLAQRLDHFSELSVVEAADGMELRNGQVYIAPGGFHMKVDKRSGKYFISLSTEPPRNGHRPSVDVLYESLIDVRELERHIVIMTGMGSDGAKGMKALVDHGVRSTIAESEQSCVVYGMPRSAVELGVVNQVLPLTQIAPEIVRKVMKML